MKKIIEIVFICVIQASKKNMYMNIILDCNKIIEEPYEIDEFVIDIVWKTFIFENVHVLLMKKRDYE